MDSSSRHKISKDVVELKNIINQLDKIDIYKLLHPTIAEYIETISREVEDKQQTVKKYLQKSHLIKNCYPKYTKKIKTQK